MKNSQHSHADRGNDLYETPPEAVRALLKATNLPTRIWEPACGPGSIARTLRDHGKAVIATDLVEYFSKDQDIGGLDFLLTQGRECDAIVTNPPFKLAAEFIRHAFALGVADIYMLLRLAFLESERRSDILDSGHLSNVWVFRNRLPMMHRHGWVGNKTSSSMAFAWFYWNVQHFGPAEISRISWEKES